MTRQHSYLRNLKPSQELAFGLVLASLSYNLEGAAALACHLLDTTAWAATEVVRSAILAGWPFVLTHLIEDSRVIQQLLQILPSLCPTLRVMVG